MINAKNFGLAAGILWGVGLFLMTLISIWTGYAADLLNLIEIGYWGYSISYVGAVIGLVYGFLDGFIGIYIFAWLYNWLENR